MLLSLPGRFPDLCVVVVGAISCEPATTGWFHGATERGCTDADKSPHVSGTTARTVQTTSGPQYVDRFLSGQI